MSTKTMTPELLSAIRCGDPVCDEDMKLALKWYEDLEEKLQMLGPEYRLAYLPVLQTRMRLVDNVMARAQNRRAEGRADLYTAVKS